MGIDGAVHGVQAIWDTKPTIEDWGFLLVDTKNAFNEINRTGMLWKVHHLLPYRSRFIFNRYHHWSSIVLLNGNGMASFLHSREGATQGDPLAMVAYCIVILPLIKSLKSEFTDVTQPWYDDDAGALGTFANVKLYFNLLKLFGPERRY